jgi:sugar transferase (PEP-CTERM/EpsH1 system associated)
MRILFLAHRLPYPPDKGDKIRSFRELAALSKKHEVDLLCFYDQPDDSRYFSDVQRFCRNLYCEKISWMRSRVQALLAVVMGRSLTTAFFHSSSMAARVKTALQSEHYDLVFAFSSSMAPYAKVATEVPCVLDMVDVDSDKWKQYADHIRPPASWLWRRESAKLAEDEKRWVSEFSLTLLCTRAESELMKQAAPDSNIEAFENPMDVSYFNPSLVEISPEIEALRPYIIFTGSMDYFPNVDAVTNFYRDVFPAIRAGVPNARFVIAGRNPAAAVRQLSDDPSVSVTGAVTDIRPYLLGAAVAVAPMRVARGVQNKILEAMAMGLPVAASRKAAMALPASLAPAVYAEDDPQRLAAFLIQKLRGAGSASAKTRQAMLDYVGEQSWDQQFESRILRAAQSPSLLQDNLPGSSPQLRATVQSDRAATTLGKAFEI